MPQWVNYSRKCVYSCTLYHMQYRVDHIAVQDFAIRKINDTAVAKHILIHVSNISPNLHDSQFFTLARRNTLYISLVNTGYCILSSNIQFLTRRDTIYHKRWIDIYWETSDIKSLNLYVVLELDNSDKTNATCEIYWFHAAWTRRHDDFMITRNPF